MIEEGVLEDPPVEAAVGLHLWSHIPIGQVAVTGGPFMAAADELYITVKGTGGHAALRDRLVDPILIACKLLPALYEEAARIKPDRSAVRDEWRKAEVLAKVDREAGEQGIDQALVARLYEDLIETSIAHELEVFDQTRG